jgi:Domain of unknown function (DUF1893)
VSIDRLFARFVNSSDTFRVYHEGKLIFSSKKEQLRPLLEYIEEFSSKVRGVVIFDRIVGNAAALLVKKAFCLEIYSPLGSEIAARTLSEQGIKYHFSRTVPYIINKAGNGICPMEKLSLGKGSEEFFQHLCRSSNEQRD